LLILLVNMSQRIRESPSDRLCSSGGHVHALNSMESEI
jgi:hypothetical protein